MGRLKHPALQIAFTTVILLCFGYVMLASAAPAAAAEPTPLTTATASAQDSALSTQATYKIKVKLSATKVYVGKRPSIKGVTVNGKSVSTSYFTFNGTIPDGVGSGHITATGKAGTVLEGCKGTTKFKVVPRGTSFSTIKPKAGGFKASWGLRTSHTTGYQLQYSKNSSFKSAKTKTIGNNETTSLTVKGLGEVKTYYVRVRTYKTISGKKYCSPWSNQWSVVTKSSATSPYQPTQKLKVETISRNGNWCYVRWTRASSWYYDSGSASSKVSGYELQWDDNKSFSSPSIRTAKEQGSYSHTISTLTPGKTYYFRVRLWNTVKAKTYYGPWSAVKSTANASQPVG